MGDRRRLWQYSPRSRAGALMRRGGYGWSPDRLQRIIKLGLCRPVAWSEDTQLDAEPHLRRLRPAGSGSDARFRALLPIGWPGPAKAREEKVAGVTLPSFSRSGRARSKGRGVLLSWFRSGHAARARVSARFPDGKRSYDRHQSVD